MRHKHADLMCAYANDASLKFEYRDCNSQWTDCSVKFGPEWNQAYDYRIKPTPKPDVCVHCIAEPQKTFAYNTERRANDNLRLTFSGETGELIKAEVLK